MKIIQFKNKIIQGYNQRSTLIDETFIDDGANLPILIFAHGFKAYKDWGQFPLVVKSFAESGFYTVSFNFSHNGGTIDIPIDFPDLEAFSNNSYWKELLDIELLLDWIINKSNIQSRAGDIDSIYILGHSRAGGISLVAANSLPIIKKVVTWASISDFEARLPNESVIEQWKKDGVRYIENSRTKQQMPMKYQFVEEFRQHAEILNIKKAVSFLTKPQLIVHGSKDSSIGVESAYQLKKWNTKAQLEIINDTQHTFGGKHPWEEKQLPFATKLAVELSAQFLKQD